MALEGSLKEFGLADILQLLYYQRKTGVLLLESRLDNVRLLFYEGRIVSAESKKRLEENRLGKVILKKGLINEQALREAIKEQKSTKARLGHILLKRGLVEKTAIQEILMAQITETVIQLLAWKEGRYAFKPQGVPLDKEIPLSIDTQHILMEGLRIVDEWTLIEGKIRLDSVFKKTGAGGIELSDEEQTILGLVDGEGDVSTIADLSGMDNFEASKTLLSLLDKGIIAPKEVPAAPKKAPPPAVKPRKRPLSIGIAVTATVLIAFALSLTALPRLSAKDINDLRASEKIDALRQEIETYMYEKGSYPPSISQITGEVDPWGQQFRYSADVGNFVLFSAGPDKKDGTKDDIY